MLIWRLSIFQEGLGEIITTKFKLTAFSFSAANKDADLHSKVANLNTTSKTNSPTTMENRKKKKRKGKIRQINVNSTAYSSSSFLVEKNTSNLSRSYRIDTDCSLRHVNAASKTSRTGCRVT